MYNSYKLLRHPERLTEWMKQGRTKTPVGFDLHLTESCPHRCPHCNNTAKSDAPMSVAMAMSILDQFREMGAKAVHFTGGEPLAHTYIGQMLEYAKQQGYSVGLITNLYRMNEQLAQHVTRSCRWVRVSLDAATPEVYAKMHGVNASKFSEVVSNLAYLTNANKTPCRIGAGYLLGPDNVQDMEEACKLAATLGCKYIQIRPMNGFVYQDIDNLKRLESLNIHEFSINIAWHKFGIQERNYQLCHGCNFWTLVTADSKLRVCCENSTEVADLNTDRVSYAWSKVRDVLDTLDVRDCPVGCRMSLYNEWLEAIACPIDEEEHI